MEIDRQSLGEYQTNCYILRSDPTSPDCLIIDPGLGADELMAFLSRRRFNPVAVVLTHGHIDHIAGITTLRSSHPEIKVLIHELDAPMLAHPGSNLSEMAGRPFATAPAEVRLKDGDCIELAGVVLQVLHTPGHTPGGICLYSEQQGVVFTDDTLFAGSIGRTDFPGGDIAQLTNSVREKLFSLPDQTVVYPGHGPATTIVREREHNPFFS